jgi:hypothetical protein
MKLIIISGEIIFALLLSVGIPVAAQLDTDYDMAVGPYSISFSTCYLITSFNTTHSIGSELLNPSDPNSERINYTQYSLHITDNLVIPYTESGGPQRVIVAIRRYNTSNNLPIIPNGETIYVSGRGSTQTYVSTFHDDHNGALIPGGYYATDINSTTRAFIACDEDQGLLVDDLMKTMRITWSKYSEDPEKQRRT